MEVKQEQSQSPVEMEAGWSEVRLETVAERREEEEEGGLVIVRSDSVGKMVAAHRASMGLALEDKVEEERKIMVVNEDESANVGRS